MRAGITGSGRYRSAAARQWQPGASFPLENSPANEDLDGPAGFGARLGWALVLAGTLLAAQSVPVEAEVLPIAAAESAVASATLARPVAMAEAATKRRAPAEAEALPIAAATPAVAEDESGPSRFQQLAWVIPGMAEPEHLAFVLREESARPATLEVPAWRVPLAVEAEALPVAAAADPGGGGMSLAVRVAMAEAATKRRAPAEDETLPVVAAILSVLEESTRPTGIAASAWRVPLAAEDEALPVAAAADLGGGGMSLAVRVTMAEAATKRRTAVEAEALPIAAATTAVEEISARPTVVAWDEWAVALLSDAEDLATRVEESDGPRAYPQGHTWRVPVGAVEPEVLGVAPIALDEHLGYGSGTSAAPSWIAAPAAELEVLPIAAATPAIEEISARPTLVACDEWTVALLADAEDLATRVEETDGPRAYPQGYTWRVPIGAVEPEVLGVAPIALDEPSGHGRATNAAPWWIAVAPTEPEGLPGTAAVLGAGPHRAFLVPTAHAATLQDVAHAARLTDTTHAAVLQDTAHAATLTAAAHAADLRS